MLFNSLEFVLFFVITYGIYLASRHETQNRLLVGASYVFYAAWDWRFLSLILVSTLVDYYCGLQIAASGSHRAKRVLLAVSVSVNLTLLGFFKYCDFFIESLSNLLVAAGSDGNLRTLNIILPVGISFYTFQTLSYSIDVYRGELQPVRKLRDFALFVAFFPQLVAGPIERARNLLPQVSRPRRISRRDIGAGLWLVLIGYFMKIFVADNLAHIVDRAFSQTGDMDGGEALTAVYAFAFQIFGDFAGYSSIAIGISRLMGFRLMTNFLYPYFVTEPSEFWRNWHISLSSWLRDYLYVGLGGSRSGNLVTCRNLCVTMLLGGMWHGAAWNFVLWGGYHGALLVLHRLCAPVLRKLEDTLRLPPVVWYSLRLFVMFHATCYGWLIFRAGSVGQIRDMTSSILTNLGGLTPVVSYNWKAIAFYTGLLIVVQIVGYRKKDPLFVLGCRPSVQAVCYLVPFLAILVWGELGAAEFIYFQF